MEFEQQSSGGHVFEPSGIGAPIPNLSELFGETTTMPIRMGSDQVPNSGEVLLGESAALNTERLLHSSNGSMKGARESRGILRGKSVRGASRDLSSYDSMLSRQRMRGPSVLYIGPWNPGQNIEKPVEVKPQCVLYIGALESAN